MSTVPKPRYTPDSISRSNERQNFAASSFAAKCLPWSGQAGNIISLPATFAAEFSEQFDGRQCEVYQSDMRVKVNKTAFTPIRTLSPTCDQPRFEDNQVDTLLNPKVIVEVLSPSTELWDRGKKFEHYRAIESLREYVLISQDHVLVERFTQCRRTMGLLTTGRSTKHWFSIQSPAGSSVRDLRPH